MLSLIKQAVRLNEEGIRVPSEKSKKLKPVQPPPDLKKALAKNKAAATVFEGFSNSSKKDYIEWLEEAKTETTRLRRLQQAVTWIAEGKKRNWKYARK